MGKILIRDDEKFTEQVHEISHLITIKEVS